MKSRTHPDDFAATAVLPADDRDSNREADTQELLYEEYLRGFDDLPVLRDAVSPPPPRVARPDFRRGERRDQRKVAREDTQSLRQLRERDLEATYREYLGAELEPSNKKKSPAKKRRKSGKGRKRTPG